MTGVQTIVAVPADDFAFSELYTRLESVECEIARVASHTDGIAPLLWITGGDEAAIDAALTADECVSSYTLLATVSGKRLYQIDWTGAVEVFVQPVIEQNGVLLSGSAAAGNWQFELLFPNRKALSRAYEAYRRYGFDLEVVRISQARTSCLSALALTGRQYKTLQAAYKHDFYEIPRGMTLSELAAELDISHQALSERLRRAHHELIGQYLQPSRGTDEDPDESIP